MAWKMTSIPPIKNKLGGYSNKITQSHRLCKDVKYSDFYLKPENIESVGENKLIDVSSIYCNPMMRSEYNNNGRPANLECITMVKKKISTIIILPKHLYNADVINRPQRYERSRTKMLDKNIHTNIRI